MKSSELTGALLDYWVARAEGSTDTCIQQWHTGPMCLSSHDAFEPVPYRPSTAWSDGGPLIEKHGLFIDRLHSGTWVSGFPSTLDPVNGPAPLVAICRAVVRAKFGDEVPE